MSRNASLIPVSETEEGWVTFAHHTGFGDRYVTGKIPMGCIPMPFPQEYLKKRTIVLVNLF